jgi:hypothetical protein
MPTLPTALRLKREYDRLRYEKKAKKKAEQMEHIVFFCRSLACLGAERVARLCRRLFRTNSSLFGPVFYSSSELVRSRNFRAAPFMQKRGR